MFHDRRTQGLILVVLSLQTGLLWLPVAQKAFLLGLALFITMSAGMQSAFDLLEPHLMQLGALRPLTDICYELQVRRRPPRFGAICAPGGLL